jgi:hypothetical protein
VPSAPRTWSQTEYEGWATAGRENATTANTIQGRGTTRSRTLARSVTFPSAQRTAVKQRSHQEPTSLPVATSEPVVAHRGREGGR